MLFLTTHGRKRIYVFKIEWKSINELKASLFEMLSYEVNCVIAMNLSRPTFQRILRSAYLYHTREGIMQ